MKWPNDEQGTRSLQRMDRLLARWREDANAMMVFADHSDSPEREECIERAKTLNDCADAIEREMAGEQPIVRVSEDSGGKDAR